MVGTLNDMKIQKFFDSTSLNLDIPEKTQEKSLTQIDLDNLIPFDEQLNQEFDCLAI